MVNPRLAPDAYTVGWICALPLELAAAKLMIKEPHNPLDSQPASDHNIYTLGRIGRHSVVFLCLQTGVYGTTSAATAVAHMNSTFRNIRFGLMVGIGGGVPTMADVRLGDVVVSKPTGAFGAIVQYDSGKSLPNGVFKQTGSLGQPPSLLLKAMSELDSNPTSTGGQSLFRRPQHDWLFEIGHDHESDHAEWSACDQSNLLKRPVRPSDGLMIHYGPVASGNQVIKDLNIRDKVARDLGAICFEMEAAGIMEERASLVIRGISDYCDSHKNKQWQGYAALVAAAYAKQILSIVPVAELRER
ncbi:5'-methylthioadenosine/S-adenosylhomocysteine nucleosidase family protein [Aspergillus mulundensis]|uniref:Nucleoside phosphorylase domain-containing protein n=1 Tax=Aspergillus mulundensis TaxID=1810919 RepID=A0A3D8QRK7_9EURO|nr:hypothetical protein DSM5745_09867 [Aspergillus mulundensis]RDW64456.1 hypothetical protein DSM5745_09867 [Aspergillus mulundensis]